MGSKKNKKQTVLLLKMPEGSRVRWQIYDVFANEFQAIMAAKNYARMYPGPVEMHLVQEIRDDLDYGENPGIALVFPALSENQPAPCGRIDAERSANGERTVGDGSEISKENYSIEMMRSRFVSFVRRDGKMVFTEHFPE